MTAPRARILVVDDEPGLQNTVRRILSRHHEVSVASSGPEALEILAQPKQYRGRGQGKPGTVVGKDPSSGKEIVLKEGRFGHYVTDGETNASLRKSDDPSNIGIDQFG